MSGYTPKGSKNTRMGRTRLQEPKQRNHVASDFCRRVRGILQARKPGYVVKITLNQGPTSPEKMTH